MVPNYSPQIRASFGRVDISPEKHPGAPICRSIDGSDVANEMLAALHAGRETVQNLSHWITELRSEGLFILAAEVEARLPSVS